MCVIISYVLAGSVMNTISTFIVIPASFLQKIAEVNEGL